MEEFKMIEFDVRKSNNADGDPDVIRFADDNGGFEACCIEKNDAGFELDSAYIKKEDLANMLKAIDKAKSLNWV